MELGLRRGTVVVVPHRSEWEAAGRQTVARLKEILKDVAADVQHVGSTAIGAICAKPIIDVAVGVTDFDRLLAKNGVLAENGFLFRGQDHPGQYLYVCGEGDFRTHHVHAVIHRSETWNDYINMRDYLNACNEDARAYSALKESLAKRYPEDRETYTVLKSEMIREILKKARLWRESKGD